MADIFNVISIAIGCIGIVSTLIPWACRLILNYLDSLELKKIDGNQCLENPKSAEILTFCWYSWGQDAIDGKLLENSI